MRINSSLDKQSTNSVFAQVGYYFSHKIKVDRGESLVELSYNLTEFLDWSMFERCREIQMVARLPSIRSNKTSVAQKQELLEELNKIYPDYAWIGLTDLQRKVITSTNGLLVGKDISHENWFQAGKERIFMGDVHEAKLLMKLLPKKTGDLWAFIDVALPILDDEIVWIASFEFNQLLYISPAYEKIFGRSCDLLYQDPTSWLELVHHQDRKSLKKALKIHKKQAQPINIKFRIVRPNVTVRWLWSQTFPIKNKQNKFYRSTGIVVDITQQKQAEAEMRRSLEQEQEINELKSRFISIASHEFRTSLNTIMSSAEILQNADLNLMQQKKYKYVENIKSSTERMIQIIEEFLLIEK